MSRVIAAARLFLMLMSIAAVAMADSEPLSAPSTLTSTSVAEGAPERYVVVSGDTLWGIAARFLKEPWRWPEIWGLNRTQIQNPHRIYPGNVVVLEKNAQGDPRLRLANADVPLEHLSPRTYSRANVAAVPSIPYDVIAPFIADPLVMDEPAHANSARIVAMQQDRFFLGKGDWAFVSGVNGRTDAVWQVYRPAQAIVDPETGKNLAFEAFYLGTARQHTPGDPAVFEITAAKQEMSRGDWMIPAVRPSLMEYVPHAPGVPVAGKIAAVYGGLGVGGRYSVVVLNRGSVEGLEPGHVLALSRPRVERFRDFEALERQEVVLPSIRYGLLFVFRTFDRLAYALVVDADGRVEINDDVRNP